MKKHIVPLVAAAFVATTSLIAAATPATNVVQTINISLEFVSQVYYTNATGGTQDSINVDVLRTNKTARTTNVIDTYTTTYKSVTNKIANKDVVAALNPSLSGGALVRVWTLVNFGDFAFYEPQFQIRKGTDIYAVPTSGSPSINFGPSDFVEVGKVVIVTNTAYGRTNVTSVATTNGAVAALVVGTFTLETSSLSCTVSGAAAESGADVTLASGKVRVQNVTANSLAGTGSDAAGNNEVVFGSVTVGGAKAEN